VKFNEPKIQVYSNVTGKPFDSSAEIAAMLQRQLVEPVMWERTMRNLQSDGRTQLFECGPGQQLKAMCKRIDSTMWKAFKNITV
jgi:[acyl-carrier-protein] S-malonyltransferase